MLRLAFGASAKGHIHALLILAVAVVSGSAVPARADDAPKNIQQSQDRLQELIGKCHNDVACLQQNASQIDGMPLLGLSLMLLKSDPNAALDWLVIAQLRTRYDVQRCTDQSVGGGMMFLFGQLGGDVVQYAWRHKMQYLAALKRVQPRDDIFAPDRAPVCGRSVDGVKPASEWPAIAANLRRQLAQEIEKLDREYAANPPPDYEPPSFPTAVPAAVLSGSRAEKVARFGAEARQAALAAAAESPDPGALFNIAEAQLNAGDPAGARETLTAAQDVVAKRPKEYFVERDRLIGLWAQAGERARALKLAERVADPAERMRSLGVLGSALAKAGDTSGARDLVDRIRQTGAASDRRVAGNADAALKEVGLALAEAGDFAGGLRTVDPLPSGQRETLAVKIAGMQCAAHDPGGRDALRAATAVNPPATQAYATELVSALAACNDIEKAKEAFEKLLPSWQLGVLDRAVDQLTKQGRNTDAELFDRIILDGPGGPNDLAVVAKRQAARGDVAGARMTAARAYEMMRAAVMTAREQSRPVYQMPEILRPFAAVLEAQLKAAAYDDALATAGLQDATNAQMASERIVQAAAKNHDTEALRQMLPRVLDAIENGGQWDPETRFIDIAKQLGRAGYTDEGREVLGRVARLKKNHCQQAPCINLAEAQVAIGDIDAAQAILQRIKNPKAADSARVMLVQELVDPESPSPTAPRRRDQPTAPPPQNLSAAFPVAAEMAWQVQDATRRASAMLVLLRSLHP